MIIGYYCKLKSGQEDTVRGEKETPAALSSRLEDAPVAGRRVLPTTRCLRGERSLVFRDVFRMGWLA